MTATAEALSATSRPGIFLAIRLSPFASPAAMTVRELVMA